jgi:hypothetical protein
MTYMNVDMKCAPRERSCRRSEAKVQQETGAMPTHIFLRLFLSALATILAIHFWKHGAR